MLFAYFLCPSTTCQIVSGMLGQLCFRYVGTKQVSQIPMRHFSHGIPQNKKNVCEEAKVIAKIEAVFFILFKPDYRDLIQKHSANILLLLPWTKLQKNFAFICKIYYISKLLAELYLSNSKSKTYAKVTQGNNSSKYKLL